MACSPPLTPNTSPGSKKVKSGGVVDKMLSCTICSEKFDDLKDCLKHELLVHSNKKPSARPQKSLRNRVNTVISILKSKDQQALQSKLLKVLRKSKPGKELDSIFGMHRMKDENLSLVYDRIYKSLKNDLYSLKTINIYPFGSFVSGLALRDSDIDLYINHPNVIQTGQSTYWKHLNSSQRKLYNLINSSLHRSKSFSDVIFIRQARVPIIKCKHISTGFSLDINLSCPSSVQNTNFLRDLLKLDKRLYELMIFLKVWAKQLQLIGRGYMTSYCLITLVIFYLQQYRPDRPAILPSIQKLQQNIPAQYIVGVNYAYRFKKKLLNLSPKYPTSKLIKGFFTFYCDFKFENVLIAPHIAKTINIEQFKSGNYTYKAYDDQMLVISKMYEEPVEAFQTGACVHLQDPFALTLNVGKSIESSNLEYFRHCLQHACYIYEDANIKTEAQRLEALLYGIVERIAQTIKPDENSNISGTISTNNPPNELSVRISPSRAEQSAIASHLNGNISQTINQLWVEYYLKAIQEIITDIYCLDLQSARPTLSDKQQRLENTDRIITWQVNGSVDQWTGRLHQRCNNKTFMELQLEQTKKFAEERRQNSRYAVELNAIITLSVVSDCSAIEFVIQQRNGKGTNISKKTPLHKFFRMFKCSMQNFNLKERLENHTT